MVDKIKPISKVKKAYRVRRIELRMHKHKTIKGLYYNEILSRAHEGKVSNKTVGNKVDETNESSSYGEKHIIDIL